MKQHLPLLGPVPFNLYESVSSYLWILYYSQILTVNFQINWEHSA